MRSPLLRCRLTVEPLAAALGLEPVVDERLSEVDYGQWTGRPLTELLREPLWSVVQQQPSAAVFPEGEGLAQVQARAVAAVREHDRRLRAEHGSDTLWVACTHGDVIKAVVADALGAHLDSFQRITADPASMSVIRYTKLRPFVLHVNHTGAQLAAVLSAPSVVDASDGEMLTGRCCGRRLDGLMGVTCRTTNPLSSWPDSPGRPCPARDSGVQRLHRLQQDRERGDVREPLVVGGK